MTKMISLVVACIGLAHFVAGADVACDVGNFVQAKTTADSMYLNCEHLYSAYKLTLEQCKALACEVGGNGFNFRISAAFGTQCYPKKCCGEVLYGQVSGTGYDVYLYNEVDFDCNLQLSDEGGVEVNVATSSSDDTGEVTEEGCRFRGETHPAGETWMQSLAEGRHKECVCPNPLPEAWTSSLYCQGACNVDGDPIYYGGQTYTLDGKNCRCNAYGKQRCS